MKKTTYLLAVIGVFTIISYQNCSQELGDLSGAKKKTSDGIPFPIDADIDTIARMSCYNNSTNNGNAYFSYKAIANSAITSGAKRSLAFDTFVNSKSGNVYENRRKYLTESTKPVGLQMQLSLKYPGDVLVNDNRNSNNFLHTDLKDSYLIEDLTNFDTPVNLSSGSYLSSKLDFRNVDIAGTDEFYEIDALGSHVTLTLDYIQIDRPENSVGPITFGESKDTSLIYGNKYKIYLADKGVNATEKTISFVKEYDSSTNQLRPNVSWSCTEYTIVRAGDSTSFCGGGSGVVIDQSTPELSKLFKLLGSGWRKYGNCVKHDSLTGCYTESLNPSVPIEYNVSNIANGTCSDAGGSNKLCANYLSVCSKTGF
ncbi:MAG: hypothetical protein KDD37_09120 [Bdellovibrionales bacterium]|nr:hypothetical protein [Bdellovibrionales bacterium]